MSDKPVESQAEIDAYNVREAWRDAIEHVKTAREALDHAAGLLEDEPLREKALADAVGPLVGLLGVLVDDLEESRKRAK